MSKFRIHNSFEEELAKKADEFTLQPRVATWRGVDRGVQKAQSIKQAIRLAIVSTCLIVTVAVIYFQNNSDDTLLTETSSETPYTPAPSENLASSLAAIAPSTPDVSERSTKKNGFTNFRSLPSFEAPRVTPSIDENPNQEEFSDEILESTLRSVAPKNIQFDIALKSAEKAQIKKRKRPISLRHKDAWYIQASFTPSTSFRTLTARTAYAEPFKELKDKNDQSVKTYSVKIGARYFFSDRFSLGFGLRYSQQGEMIGMSARKQNSFYEALAEEYHYNAEQMYSIGNTMSHMNQYHYIELPVTLYAKRQLGKRFSLHTGIGLSLGYLMKESSRTYDFRVDHYVDNANFLRSWTVGAHAQASIGYDIDTRWMLSVGPEVNYALLSTYQNYYTLSQHQYSFGLNLGVQWKLFDGTKSSPFGSK